MKMNCFWHLRLSLIVSVLWNVEISFQIYCKDENDRDVDWFVVYKLPTIEREKEGSYLRTGKGYVYFTSEDIKKKGDNLWTLSNCSIESKESMLAKTWQNYKNANNKHSDIAYLFYNDGPPIRHKGKSVGHLKGYIAFDSKSGIWLMHSIPKFGNAEEYRYPRSALKNGQIAMCMTFDTRTLKEICHHLLYCHPNIYDAGITNELKRGLDKNAISIFTKKPAFKKKPAKRETPLYIKDGSMFLAFAKDNQLKVDIYSQIIAPCLRTDLLVQSWRIGRGKFYEPVTRFDNSVEDIASINMTVKNRPRSISFKSKEDHSKWAVSTSSGLKWVCIGDLNRMLKEEAFLMDLTVEITKTRFFKEEWI